MGHLTVIIGCMFAQKTTELLRHIRRYRSIGFKVLVINYKHDTRYGESVIASHDLDTVPARAVENLAEITEEMIKDYDVIVIDEGQFYSDLVDNVTKWVDGNNNLKVVVSGLDGDARRQPFGQMLQLIPHAERVERLSSYCAVCRDGTAAYFSKRIVASETTVDIGAADKYLPVCRFHWLS
jgi:thymidine kinase